ncbi:MAG: hypothetical protein AAB884_01540 [Patescibacteria group bacterium]
MVKKSSEAWVVAVSMGYGHQRTAYPLEHLSPDGRFINANDYEGIPQRDKHIWESSRRFYEFISNFKRLPVLGSLTFRLFDRFQKILNFYPKRNLSEPTLVLKQIYRLIKGGWGKHLIETLKRKPIPLITTFPTPAFMAEFFNYPNDIYCTIADTDIARTWAPLEPNKSRIKYLATTERVVERLQLYGIKKESIFLTGYPLPKENVGLKNKEIAKTDLAHRLLNLDPKRKYYEGHQLLVEKYLGKLPTKSNHPLTIMFSIGGAGAQKELGFKIMQNLKYQIKTGVMYFYLASGVKRSVRDYFLDEVKALGLERNLGEGLKIISGENTREYFKKFNEALRTTDILWTKPSELSFYCALGLPIVIAPPIGSQEDFNREWLLSLGTGVDQEKPEYIKEWISDYLESGRFAEAAMEGFIEAENLGTHNIEKLL